MNNDQMSRDNMISAFHALGMKQYEICYSLAQYGFVISERHLRRILNHRNLSRRKDYSDIGDVALYIQRELQAPWL